MKTLIVPICLLILIATTAAAQTPATGAATATRTPAPPPGWSGQASLSFVNTAGNSHARALGLDAKVFYRPDKWLATDTAAYARNSTDGVLSAESLTNDLMATRQITVRLSGYGRLDYLRNRFAGINDRVSTDAGVGYDLFPPEGRQLLQITVGLGYSHESDLAGFSQSFGTDNAGAAYALVFSKTSQVTDEAKYTGNLADAGNWRLRNTAAVTAAINATFALKLSHRLDFVNQPVPGFGRTDQITSAAVVVSF